ncbi:unnamed protein product, partial [Tetraodon nigroviridis]
SLPPPPHQETARTSRYIAHYSDWAHLATISTQDKENGFRSRGSQMCTSDTDRQDGCGGTRGGCICKGSHVFQVIYGTL